jgi:rubrerythrin
MANVFNAAEIIDMGIEKEKKRRDFYALVAESFSDEEIKGLFTKLRDWEETHIEKFS